MFDADRALVGGLLGAVGAFWAISWFYHLFFEQNSWTSIAVVMSGVGLFFGIIALCAWAAGKYL